MTPEEHAAYDAATALVNERLDPDLIDALTIYMRMSWKLEVEGSPFRDVVNPAFERGYHGACTIMNGLANDIRQFRSAKNN